MPSEIVAYRGWPLQTGCSICNEAAPEELGVARDSDV